MIKSIKTYNIVFSGIIIILLALVVYSYGPHRVTGKVYNNDGTNVPNGITVWLNVLEPNNQYRTTTYGPPPSPNNYLYDVEADDGDTVVVRAWNDTHYGQNSTTLIAAPGTTYLNIIINTSRNSEANITIITPGNHSSYSAGDIFNVTANFTILGNDSTGCFATISFGNASVINVSSTESESHSFGDIVMDDQKNTSWVVSAKAPGSSNITVNASCNTDGVNLLGLNSYVIYNITVNPIPPTIYLESPINNTWTYDTNRMFYYNVSSYQSINNCSLILNGAVNNTNFTITKDVSQNFTAYNINPGQYNWNINCTDNLGLIGSSESYNLTIIPVPDLKIISDWIVFSNINPTEGENITINATIVNMGIAAAMSFNVSFFEGNYSNGIQIDTNVTVDSLAAGANITVSVNWTVKQGTYNMDVIVDPPIGINGSITESNETNNVANKTISIAAMHIIVGNISGSLVLGAEDATNLVLWAVTNMSGSKIYVADLDSSIDFTSLWAFGRNLSNATKPDDFEELDTILNTENYSDSINMTFTSGGNAIMYHNFTVFRDTVYFVPVVNSTNSSKFITGILWDSSEDNSNGGTIGEYDSTDREAVVFVTEARETTVGKYGAYNFEIMVPANIRTYVDGGDISSVSLYGELK